MLLRGSTLKNTKWIIGLVAYTGYDTKTMRNEQSAPHKTSKVEIFLNKYIMAILLMQFVLCLSMAILLYTNLSNNTDLSYLMYIFY